MGLWPSLAAKCLAADTLLKLKLKGAPMLRAVCRRCRASGKSSNRSAGRWRLMCDQ